MVALCDMTGRLLVVLAIAAHPPKATGFHVATRSSPSTDITNRCRRRQYRTSSEISPTRTITTGGSVLSAGSNFPSIRASGIAAADRSSLCPRYHPLGTTRRAALLDAAAAIDNFYVTSPYAAAAITCGAKASAADFVAQRRHIRTRAEEAEAAAAAKAEAEAEAEENEEDSVEEEMTTPLVVFDDDNELEIEVEPFHKARNVAFLLYGGIYQGMAQEFIYNHLYPVWFGSGTSVPVVLTKVAFDLLIQTTLVTLPVAYLVKSAIFRYSPAEGLGRYMEDIRAHGLLNKYFLLWGPVQCLTFGVVPEHLRVSFIALVSFFWLIILSTVSARPRQADSLAEVEEEGCSLVDGSTCNIDG